MHNGLSILFVNSRIPKSIYQLQIDEQSLTSYQSISSVIGALTESWIKPGIESSLASTERMYVLAVRGGTTVKVDVSRGYKTATEIDVMGELQPGENVIANANEEIAEGVAVK